MKSVFNFMERLRRRKDVGFIERNNLRYHQQLFIGDDFLFGEYSTVNIHPNSLFKVGNKVEFRKYCNILLYENANLTIKPSVFFNNYCSINCLGKIEIGGHTLFGEGVKIYDHNHAYFFDEKKLVVERDKFKIGSIRIGDNCWIGSNVVILNNVEIGDNVIIGAGCLIHKSIPSNSIVKANTSIDIQHRFDG
jgi:acetyltransferase-like isoleucine patch superfamily enzyme